MHLGHVRQWIGAVDPHGDLLRGDEIEELGAPPGEFGRGADRAHQGAFPGSDESDVLGRQSGWGSWSGDAGLRKVYITSVGFLFFFWGLSPPPLLSFWEDVYWGTQ